MIPLIENLCFLSHHHAQNSNENMQLLVIVDGYSNNIYISKECYNDMSYVPLKSIKEKKEKKKNNEKKNEKKKAERKKKVQTKVKTLKEQTKTKTITNK